MKIRALPAAAVLGLAVLAGAGGAYALTAAAPSVVQQAPTVQFRSAAAVEDATTPAPTARAVPTADPVAVPVTAPAPRKAAAVDAPAPSAPKAKVAAAPVQDPAPAPAEEPVASKPAVPPATYHPPVDKPGPTPETENFALPKAPGDDAPTVTTPHG